MRSGSIAGLAWMLAGPVLAGPCLPYEPEIVTLVGRVTMGEAFGPPNFGEDPAHDARERYGQLTLAAPVCVAGRPGDDINSETERDVTALQLVFPLGQSAARFVGHRVSVAGTLFHQHTGHHHTAVLLHVASARRR